jgi:cytochrome c peroxidase
MLVSGAHANLLEQSRERFEPIPTDVQEVFKLLHNNPPSPERLELGKMLWFEPRISRSQLISCNTCHNLSFGGSDYQETSTGHSWQRGPRNSPTVLNSVFNHVQFWDGRSPNLKEQAKGPIQDLVEMAATPEHVVAVLRSMPQYVELFRKAFPGERNPVTFDNVARAIELFEATLITPNSRFDNFLRGDQNALNRLETNGLSVFINRGCDSCHSGVNFSSEGFHGAGIASKDKGRFNVTQDEGDKATFKAPSLRNIELTAPYFHTGTVWTLEEAVAMMGSTHLNIRLSNNDVRALVAFLKTLTGEQPRIVLPILPPSTNTTPRPMLD